jgi:hypothetical protein
VLDSAYFAGTISGETNTGGVIGAVTQSSIIVNSAANGVVIGGRAVGGLVGTISEAFNEPLEEGGILIRRSSFQGVLGGLTEIRNFPSAVGGIVGSVGNIERTIARHPPIPFLQTPQFSAVVIDRSYATGEFDLRQPVGVNSSSGIFIYPRNSYCGGFIGAVGTSQTASFIDVRQSYADMKPTRWAFDTPQTLRHLEEFPLLASNPNVVKLGLTGGTCQALGGMAGDAMLSRGSSVFNLENTPYLHFLADGVNGPLYRFSEPVFNQLQQYLVRVSPLRLDAYVSGVTQGQMMSIQTYLDRGWSIAPTEKRTGPIPTWRIQEGSYPYLSDEQWGIREEQEEAKRGQGENYSTNLLR